MFVLTWCSFHLALDRLVFIPLGVGSLGVPSLGVGSLGVHSQHQDMARLQEQDIGSSDIEARVHGH